MSRRSIRKFTDKPLTDNELKTILKAGFQAPSAHNREPREFIVIDDKNKLEKIKEYHPYAKMIVEAGLGIFVCGDMEKQDNLGFLVSDCSASIQNMLLAAHSIGLGAVWCGIYNEEKLIDPTRKLLNLPKHIMPIGLVVVGNTEDKRNIIDRYNKDNIHKNIWDK